MPVIFLLMAVLFPFFASSPFRHARRVSHLIRQKSRSLRHALGAFPQSGGVACRPVIGPAARRFGRTDRPSLYKWHANSVASKKPFGINRKILIAGFCGSAYCCHSLHRARKPAASLCSAKK
jgi:hypothetical protein